MHRTSPEKALSYRNEQVLVTGAGGFIGSHLAEALVQAGASVRAFIHYNSRADEGNLKYLEPAIRREIQTVWGDLHDPDSVKKAVCRAHRVFHLGALIAIPYSYIHPYSFIQTNVLGTANILNACLESGTERLITTSTSEVYGTAVTTPMSEDHRLHPQSPYAASKASADHLAQSYCHSFGLQVVVVRPFNTFGPRQSTRAVIPTIIVQALRDRAIRIGSTWPTRDFNFVSDVARAFVLAGEADRAIGEVLNIGSGQDHTIAEVIEQVSRILGADLPVTQDDGRLRPPASEVGRLLADSTRARDLLGWSPQFSFGEALERTMDWYEAYEEHIAYAHAV